MGMNLDQVYIANPITSNANTDLMYNMQSPYSPGTDAAITFANFKAQFPSATSVDVASSTQQLAINTAYITDNGASLVTYTLPVTASIGAIIKITGKSSGGWKIVYATGQSIIFQGQATTTTTGSLGSSIASDCAELMCTTANTTWTVINASGCLAWT